MTLTGHAQSDGHYNESTLQFTSSGSQTLQIVPYGMLCTTYIMFSGMPCSILEIYIHKITKHVFF
jgi:hypothetical protein